MIWNADLALCCLYLTMTHKSKIVDFSLSAFIFILNFSIFEMRLLYLSYRSQDIFNNPQLQDPELQKKKMLRFYFILCKQMTLINTYMLFRWSNISQSILFILHNSE